MPMSKHRDTVDCERCQGKAEQVITLIGVNGGQISETERRALEVPFGRNRAKNIKTVGDIDRTLDKFHKKYPCFQRPDRPPIRGSI